MIWTALRNISHSAVRLSNAPLKLTHRALGTANTIIDPSFGLTNEEKQLQATALQFALNEFRPFMRQWDEEQIFPREQLRKAGQLGFGGLFTPAEDGGSGLTRLQSSVIFEALAQGCVSTTALMCIHNMCASMLSTFGSEQLKQRLLPGLVTFDLVASYCLTEADAGSDAASLRTTAVQEGDYFRLNGSKAFISGGGESDVYFVMCRTGSGTGAKGISCILVEKDSPGLSFGKKEQKLGWNSQPTRSVIFEDCQVPATNLLGVLNRGFNQIMHCMNGGRLNIASCSLGAAQFAMEETIKYSSERSQFKTKLFDFQNTQFKLASYAADLLAARLVIRAAARRIDEEADKHNTSVDIDDSGIQIPGLTAAAKLLATEKAFTIVDGCLQIFGGYGYLKDFPIQQLLRDSRIHRILGGTSEIMQLIIARDFR